MQLTNSGLIACYGRYLQHSHECGACEFRRFCRSERAERRNSRIGTVCRDVSNEVAQGLEAFATLPAVYETPGGKTRDTWRALVQIMAFLTSLQPAALAALRLKVMNPDWQREQAAAALQMRRASFDKNIVHTRRGVAAAFNTQNVRKKMENLIQKGAHVYLSGPMTGIAENNAPAFHDAEEQLRERYECDVINPVFTSNLIGDNRTHEDYMQIALAMVRTSQVVVMLPGWRESVGALMEYNEAAAFNIEVFELEQVL